MLSVLFWNLMGRDREARVASLVRTHAPTVLILTECRSPRRVLSALNPAGTPPAYHLLPNANHCRVRLFSRVSPLGWPLVEASRHFTLRRLTLPTADELLLVAVHLRSRLLHDERELVADLRRLAARIRQVERARGHTRTLLIGDLNAHPFQEGVYSADGLHAVMTRQVARQRQRASHGEVSPFFYNPMWGLFGERATGPPATYFWRDNSNAVLFWHMLDQVLLRPDLLPHFPAGGAEVLTHDGTMSLQAGDGRPDPEVGSDHFPLLTRLNYPGV